jgi:sulfotransferase family protein
MRTNGHRAFADFYAASRDLPIYIILGVQGSGTNLLRKFLVTAFNFSVLQDKALVFNAGARLGAHPTTDDVIRQFAQVQAAMFPSPLSRKLTRSKVKAKGAEPLRGMDKHFDPATIRSGADFARFFYAYRAFTLGTPLMAIKSDDIWEHIGEIDNIVPNRQVVLITRDFRDNLLSVSGKNFGPIEPVCAAEYVKGRFAYYDAEYRRAGTRGYHVRYESMLQDPRQFLLDFARRYGLSFVKDPDEVVAEMALRPNKVGKWRSLDARQLAWCEAILRPELAAYGYVPATNEGSPPDAITRLAARTRDAWKRVPQKLRKIRQRLAQ